MNVNPVGDFEKTWSLMAMQVMKRIPQLTDAGVWVHRKKGQLVLLRPVVKKKYSRDRRSCSMYNEYPAVKVPFRGIYAFS